jgi:response regulator RpfG family c-di-GMP phosphodiesterase
MTSIAVIDDNPVSLALAKRTLERAGFQEIRTYSEAARALREIREAPPSIVLVDYIMPEMDGIAFIEALRREGLNQQIPIALMSDSAQVEVVRVTAFEAGAVDVLRKPLNLQEIGLKLRNLGRLVLNETNESNSAETLDHSTDKLQTIPHSSTANPVKSIFRSTPQELQLATFLQRTASIRDEATGMHTARMAQYAGAIADAYGFDSDRKAQIIAAAPLHDIGMISIPDSILLKLRNLLPEEEDLMRLHTVIGHQLLRHESMPLMNLAAEIALAHHECWDGSGYPNQLKGEAIPIAARIVAVADTFDCMSCLGDEGQTAAMHKAREIILSNSGLHFDPEVVAAFIKAFTEILNIKHQFDGDGLYRPCGEDTPQMLQLN